MRPWSAPDLNEGHDCGAARGVRAVCRQHRVCTGPTYYGVGMRTSHIDCVRKAVPLRQGGGIDCRAARALQLIPAAMYRDRSGWGSQWGTEGRRAASTDRGVSVAV